MSNIEQYDVNRTYDHEIYEGVTHGEVLKKIMNSTDSRRVTTNLLLHKMNDMIKDVKDGVIIIPLIAEILKLGTKNDSIVLGIVEQSTKLLNVSTKSTIGLTAKDSGFNGLAIEDYTELLKEIDDNNQEIKTLGAELENTSKKLNK